MTPEAREVIEAIPWITPFWSRDSLGEKQRSPSVTTGLFRLDVARRSREVWLLLFRDGLFFKTCDALVEVANRLFERGDRSDERTEGDLHIA